MHLYQCYFRNLGKAATVHAPVSTQTLTNRFGRVARAIYSETGADLGSTGSVTFVGNAAKDYGGALHLTSYGKLQVSNTTFRENVADVGGAVFIAGGGNTISEFSACVFDANIASDGGALYLYTGAGTEIFTSSVFRYNFASKWSLAHGLRRWPNVKADTPEC